MEAPEQVKIAVVEQFVRELPQGYDQTEEEMVWVLEGGGERTLWLGPKPEEEVE